MNVSKRFDENCFNSKDKQAIIKYEGAKRCDSPLNYESLEQIVSNYAFTLESIGITEGSKVIILIKPDMEFYFIMIALFKMGALPVLIDPGMGIKNVVNCLKSVEADACIALKEAHILRFLFPGHFKTVKSWITTGKKFLFTGLQLKKLLPAHSGKSYPSRSLQPTDPSAIIFTTGSTGVAKGARYNQITMEGIRSLLKENFSIGPDEINIATFPAFNMLDFVFGITTVITDLDVSQPAEVNVKLLIDILNREGVTQMFASPVLVKNMADYGIQSGVRLKTLKKVITGGAPLAPDVIRDFNKIMPADGEIYSTYGATEALPIAAISGKETINETGKLTELGRGTCVGRPLRGVNLKIIESSDGAVKQFSDCNLLATGEVGEIIIKADNVSPLYYNNDFETERHKIKDNSTSGTNGGVWHRTGDLGYLDEQGRIWFCGRKRHAVKADGRIYYSCCCEAVINTNRYVKKSALVAAGKGAAICIELEMSAPKGERKKILEELKLLAESNPVTAGIECFLFYKKPLPVDVRHNSKIDRVQLAAWAEKRLRKYEK